MTGVVALGSFTATGMCMPPSTIRPVQFREPAEIRPLGPMVSWFCPGFGDRSTTPLMMTPPTGWRVREVEEVAVDRDDTPAADPRDRRDRSDRSVRLRGPHDEVTAGAHAGDVHLQAVPLNPADGHRAARGRGDAGRCPRHHAHDRQRDRAQRPNSHPPLSAHSTPGGDCSSGRAACARATRLVQRLPRRGSRARGAAGASRFRACGPCMRRTSRSATRSHQPRRPR